MKNQTKTSRLTIAFVHVVMVALVLAGIFLSIQIVIAIKPFESLLPSKEGVLQWRYYTHAGLLDYSFEVDHVYKRDTLTEEGIYYKMLSVRLPAVYFKEGSNNEETKNVLVSKNKPEDIFASVSQNDSAVMVRIKDQSLQQAIMWGYLMLILFAMTICLYWLWEFRKLIRSIGLSDSTFNTENISRLNRLGFIILGASVLQLLFEITVYAVAMRNFNLVSGGDIDLNPSIHPGMIAFGLTLVVLAGVFREGVQLKEEQALTI